jgi:four helix bundle protein
MGERFNLEKRTGEFGRDIILFAKKVPKNTITLPLIQQLVRSGTSIGANYCEADCAESRKDFEHKLGICKKESKETKHWLRMIAFAEKELSENSHVLWKEANELQLIFITIIKNSKNTKNVLEIGN